MLRLICFGAFFVFTYSVMAVSSVIDVASQVESEGDLLTYMEKKISPQNYSELKSITKELAIKGDHPLSLKVVARRKVQFGKNKGLYTLSTSGRHLRYQNSTFKLDKKKSLFWNYSNITSILKKVKSSKASVSLIPMAHADSLASPQRQAYEILILLYL